MRAGNSAVRLVKRDFQLIILKVFLSLIAAALLIFAGLAGYAFILMKNRPPLKLYAMRSEEPDFLPLDQIPSRLIELLIGQEDPNFYIHHGYDAENIRKAWKKNFRQKHIVLGGSTITQQLAKNLYLHFSRNYLRKLVELLIALKLEQVYGKDRILEMYINIIYFGNGTYGITDATRFYFDKPVPELTLNQMVMLTIIPPAPTAGNPIQHPDMFLRLRSKFLSNYTKGDHPLVSQTEAEAISAHGADCLDPELRKPDDFTRSYPQTIPLINERFGPFAVKREAR